jgi:hypothetical protein
MMVSMLTIKAFYHDSRKVITFKVPKITVSETDYGFLLESPDIETPINVGGTGGFLVVKVTQGPSKTIMSLSGDIPPDVA